MCFCFYWKLQGMNICVLFFSLHPKKHGIMISFVEDLTFEQTKN